MRPMSGECMSSASALRAILWPFMTDYQRIDRFLQRARGRALLEVGLRAGGYAVAGLGVSLLTLAVLARLSGPAASWPYVAFGSILLSVACGIALGYVRPARALEDPAAVARLVGDHQPPLASDILSAVELEAARTGGAEVSADMARAFCAAVADRAAPIVVEDLIPLRRAVRAILFSVASLLLLLGAALALPSVVGRGMRTLFHTPTLFEGALAARDPLVGDVRVTYDFPAYTGLPRQIIEGSTGDLHALRGTRVHIEMRPLRTVRQARLLMGESGEEGVRAAELSHGRLTTSLDLLESGAYRVWLLPFLGRPVREDRAHRIVVESDQPPEVDVVGPADRLELATPRPVEVAYHARDDFGLAEVALVYRVDDGREQRILLKNAQGMREVRGTTSFEPTTAMLTPGARVAYHIEAKDRDDVSGSKLGVSRTLYLVIQNPREDKEERLVHQREVLDRLVGVLGDRIELDNPGKAMEPPQRTVSLREAHDSESLALQELARVVEEQRRAGDAAKVAGSTLAAAAARLSKLMREETEAFSSHNGKAEQGAAALWGRLRAQAPRHIAELENTVLTLDDLIGRQRLDELASIGQDLVAAHKRLQDLLERYKATGDEQLRRQIEREVRELRARVAELAHKIAEVKARNEISPEWMNVPDTHKALEQIARFDSLLAKGDAKALAQALSDLGDSLTALRESLDKNASGFGGARFPQESRATAELLRKIGDLEGDERGLADDSRALAKEVDTELARRLEAQQATQMGKIRQKLDQIQHKLVGPPPRELGSNGEAAAAAIRDNVRQLRRMLGAKEWNEASREAERMSDGLLHLQHLSGRQVAVGRPPSSTLLAYDGQVDDASALARELAADLARILPHGGEVMSAEQQAQSRNLGQRQSGIEEKARGLSHDLGSREDSVPGAGPARGELEEIADQMRQAGEELGQGSAREGAGRATDIADRLAKLRQSMGQPHADGSRASREPVRIPEADEYKAPREWRQELMEAMRERAPEKFRDEVRRYYEELVK
jgi:hypothetical protein